MHAVLAAAAGALCVLSGREPSKWYGFWGALGGAAAKILSLEWDRLSRLDVCAGCALLLALCFVKTAPWSIFG